jgi:actin related protein 2/3 complex subunit 1A/1B
LGSTGSVSSDTKLNMVHQNTITSIRPYESHGNYVARVSTTGVDGTLVIWDTNEISALTGKMGGMRI